MPTKKIIKKKKEKKSANKIVSFFNAQLSSLLFIGLTLMDSKGWWVYMKVAVTYHSNKNVVVVSLFVVLGVMLRAQNGTIWATTRPRGEL